MDLEIFLVDSFIQESQDCQDDILELSGGGVRIFGSCSLTFGKAFQVSPVDEDADGIDETAAAVLSFRSNAEVAEAGFVVRVAAKAKQLQTNY